MKQLIQSILIITFIFTAKLNGQSAAKETPIVLEKLFNRLVNNYNDSSRIQINDSIRTIVDSFVRSDSAFKHRFTNLRHLGQIMSPDSLLKIVTWNLVLGNSAGMYYCYFIRKGEKGKGNKVYSLVSEYRADNLRTDTTYSGTDWYGALYYDLKPFVINKERCWVLLGIDYGNPLISRKIIDVLRFTDDDSVLLGRKWFESDDKIMFRAVFEYASNAMMTLRFASGKSIVFDHLVPFSSTQKDDHQYYGPDYSYDAFNFKNGVWKFSLNVDARNNQ